MLATLHHPNIIQFYGVARQRETSTLYIVEEFAPGGDLTQLMQSSDFTPHVFCRIVMDLLGGLCYMHALNVAHRDLKPQNLLLSSDGRVKIVDLGNARDFQKTRITAGVGTAAYMPPEAFDAAHVVSESDYPGWAWDIFSLGMLLWQLYYRKDDPWGGASVHQIISKLFKAKRPEFHEPSPPPTLRSLIEACWSQDFFDRPQVHTVKAIFEEQVVPIIRSLTHMSDWEAFAQTLEGSDDGPPSPPEDTASLRLLRERVNARRKLEERSSLELLPGETARAAQGEREVH